MNPAPTQTPARSATAVRLPVIPLVLLAAMGVVLISMETMPAGLLPQIARGMHTTQSIVGLYVSAFALGTVVATIPAIALTRGLRRKPLLVTAALVLLAANTITALSTTNSLSLATRFVAGAMTGTLWGMIATYARRISPPQYAGRALAITSTGAPIGFALGTPLGAWLGTTFSWRWSFAALSLFGAAVLAMLVVLLPDAPGNSTAQRLPLTKVFRIRGISIILAVIVAWMLAHNTIYTYISPFLQAGTTQLSAGAVLFAYGIAAIAGVVITGIFLDRHPRPLLHLSAGLFVVAGALIFLGHNSAPVTLLGASLWGITFGGAATQMQAALMSVGRENADVASSFLPVAFNIAIFTAGIFGAALLTSFNALILSPVMIAFGTAALLLTFLGRRSAFQKTL